MEFLGEMENFFWKLLKKVVEIFWQKFGPPVSEVLDPLVWMSTVISVILSDYYFLSRCNIYLIDLARLDSHYLLSPDLFPVFAAVILHFGWFWL